MLQVTENKDEIVIQDKPFKKWFISGVAALILFAFVFEFTSGFFDSNLVWSLGITVFILVIFGFQFGNPVTTIKINRPGKTVSIRKQSLIKYSFDVYSFDEIDDFVYIEITGGRKFDDATSYQLMMPMKDGRKIALSASNDTKDEELSKIVQLANVYIFDISAQIPFKNSGFLIDR